MARTVYGEIRNGDFDSQVAVAWTIRNRADHPRWWGHDIRGVCLQPLQYSCWNSNDPNRPIIEAATLEVPSFRACYYVTLGVYDRRIPDPTNGATHYHTIAQPAWAVKWPPRWADLLVPLDTIGPHRFYVEV